MTTSWTVPGESRKDSLLRHAKDAVPRFFSKSARGAEDLNGLAEILANGALAQLDDLNRQTFIDTAEGKWLRQHAKDRAVAPQENEPPEALRERIRNVEDTATRPSLLAAINAMLLAAGVSEEAVMVELRRDRIYLGTFEERTGTGGTFATHSGLQSFEPLVAFPLPVEVGFPRSGDQGNPRLVISGAASAGNDGTFEITDLAGNAALFANGSANAEEDATVSWSLRRYNIEGNNRDGFARAYLGRGYRMSTNLAFIVILPETAPVELEDAARDLLRLKKAAGFSVRVERRA